MRSMEGGKYKHYAIRNERVTGQKWSMANKQVQGFSGCESKGFTSYRDAFKYLNCRDDGMLLMLVDQWHCRVVNPIVVNKDSNTRVVFVVDDRVGGFSHIGVSDIIAANPGSTQRGAFCDRGRHVVSVGICITIEGLLGFDARKVMGDVAMKMIEETLSLPRRAQTLASFLVVDATGGTQNDPSEEYFVIEEGMQ
ncbi:hypothetical protein PIB30_060126 [Stylosanthes scabra]|uniref:Ribonuclease H1 N-terminal domain-containing protein n=1 Tax=Stylosanthes scabra TaxID=79078 RepID=A0ABU6XKA6_9FABA|nr:hypothetical protein [Stylosanthes scabra]